MYSILYDYIYLNLIVYIYYTVHVFLYIHNIVLHIFFQLGLGLPVVCDQKHWWLSACDKPSRHVSGRTCPKAQEVA